MNPLFNKKRKNPPELSQQAISPGTPANIATGSHGSLAELDVGPEGGWCRSYRNLEVDQPDLTAVPGDRSGRGAQVVFQDRMYEDQEPPMSQAWAFGVVMGRTEDRNDPMGECL